MEARNGFTRALGLMGALQLAPAQDETPAELPIRSVVLYKHGLGYFERSARVRGSRVAALRFSAGQMNDVLKSLTALDLDGGRISTIGYDSQAPAGRLLKEFGFELPREGAIVALLKLFRGAQVEVKLGGETVVGSVVGVEPRQVAGGDESAAKGVEVQRVTLLTAEGSAVSFDADEVQSVRFLDRDLAEDVRRYLEILRDSYRAERKSMQLRLEGADGDDDREREVFVSYTVEAPVWKASYRLVLGEQDLLQGWAIVDNTSDEDWNDVELSLVSGLPVSFVQDLYTPRYMRRPVVEVAQELAVAPQTHEGGFDDEDKVVEPRSEKAKVGGERRRAAPGLAAVAADAAAPMARAADFERRASALADSLEAVTTHTRELGNLFEYRIDHPVTVKRNRSALIPIVGARIDAEKVALFNQSVRERNPLAAVRLKNGTGLTLEGGPVTVLDDGTYAGEALIDTLEPDQERYLSYAVDLAVTVDTKQESGHERVARVRLLNGIVWMDSRIVATTGYSIRNGDEKARRIIVEHPRRPGFTLDPSHKPLEETHEHWRFAVDVGAEAAVLFTVKEEYGQETQYALTNLSSDDLEVWIRRKLLSAEMEKELRELVVIKGEIAGLERRAQQVAEDLGAVGRDQERLRKNLGALGNTSAEQQLRTRYVEQLQKSEDRIGELSAKKQELDSAIAEKRARLDERIRGLVLEHKI